jgi:hypothetical protein
LFVGFTATMAGSDFSRSYIIGYGSSPSRHGPVQHECWRWPTMRSPGSRAKRNCRGAGGKSRSISASEGQRSGLDKSGWDCGSAPGSPCK